MDTKKVSFKGFTHYLSTCVSNAKSDWKRIYEASRSTAMLLLVVEVYLGLAVVGELLILSNLVDALIGARAIETVTTDVTKYVWWQIGLFVSLLPVLAMHHQFEGVVAKLGTTIRQTAFIVGSGIVALPISIVFVTLFIVGSLFERYAQHRLFTIGYSLTTIILASWLARNIVSAGAHRVATVGDVVLWAGAMLALAGYLALRPYLVTK